MTELVLRVPGEPFSKARARVTKHGTYTPKATREAEAKVRAAMTEQHPGLPDADTVQAFRVGLTSSRYERRARDGDNLLKLVLDALNGVVWGDDSQVEEFDWTTHWVDRREDAGSLVVIRPLGRPARPPRT